MASVDTSMQVDIVNDPDFKEANCTFKNISRELKGNGKEKIQHYSKIEPEDIKKLYENVDVNTPECLLYKVWFDAIFRLGRRGRENMRDMTRGTFAVGTDDSFTKQQMNLTDENDRSFETIGEASIYEIPGSPKCLSRII